MTNARAISDWIESNFDAKKCRNADDVIDEAITEIAPDIPRIRRAELVEELYEGVLVRLHQRIDRNLSLGRVSRFTIERHYIRGVDFHAAGTLFSHALTEIDVADALSSLTETEFEYLAGALLQVLEATTKRQTQQSRDGGVDWYANILLPIRGTEQARVLVIIDCKSSQYNVNMLREFIAASDAEIGKRLTGQTSRIPSGISVRSNEPRLLVVATAKEATTEARQEAERRGVVILERSHIARILYPYLDNKLPALAALRALMRSAAA